MQSPKAPANGGKRALGVENLPAQVVDCMAHLQASANMSSAVSRPLAEISNHDSVISLADLKE